MMLIERPVRVRPWYRRAASCLLAEEVEEIKKEDRLRVERGEALKARRLCRVLHREEGGSEALDTPCVEGDEEIAKGRLWLGWRIRAS